MCDSATSSAIDAVVSDLAGQGIMFTAFDVTKKVWVALGHDASERWPQGFHSSIKNDVHRAVAPFIQSGVYERQMINVGTSVMPFVYYPMGGDPTSYQASASSNNQTVAGVNPLAQLPSTPSIIDDKGQGPNDGSAVNGFQRKLTPYHRLCVPNLLMKHAGFMPGEVAYLTAVGSAIEVCKRAVQTPIATYVVDVDTNIRIMAGTIEKAGLDPSKEFKFSGDADKVTIENI